MKRRYLYRIRRQSTYSNTRDNINLLVKILLVLSVIPLLFGLFVFFAGSKQETVTGIFLVVSGVASAISIKVSHALVNVFFDIADSIIDLNYRYDYQ